MGGRREERGDKVFDELARGEDKPTNERDDVVVVVIKVLLDFQWSQWTILDLEMKVIGDEGVIDLFF